MNILTRRPSVERLYRIIVGEGRIARRWYGKPLMYKQTRPVAQKLHDPSGHKRRDRRWEVR